ncbi:MAG TPA: fumarylacetoacetate hydrolase family protein [Allosphingosinicella sp.]|nr:fumarylacetoacetate hydrolase family protein [Allosphingosinicella sp.]
MMDESFEPDVAAAAGRLSAALRSREACDPVRPLVERAGVEGAYAAQRLLEQEQVAAGARVIGRKIGLTSAAVQTQLGVDQPDFGFLTDLMAFGDAQELPFNRLIAPRVEAEVAFVMGKDLEDDGLALPQVIRAVEFALPAIEVVDSRVRDWKISIYDTVADNASSGLFVLGGSPRKLDRLDLRLCGMSLTSRGEPVSVGCGAACMGNPVNALLWLARTMQKNGSPLREGDVVLSGALGPMVPARAGATYSAAISGLGSVSAVFSAEG